MVTYPRRAVLNEQTGIRVRPSPPLDRIIYWFTHTAHYLTVTLVTITMTTPNPAPARSYPSQQTKPGKASQRALLAATYCHPLPLVPRPPTSTTASSRLLSLLTSTSKSIHQLADNPECTAVWDAYTGAVWVTSQKDIDILWTRGFFGKGSLSRSEPS